MAASTTTTLGTIILSGDLYGSDANSPALVSTGVTPVSDILVNKIYIDTKGRTTNISEVTSDILAPLVQDASDTVMGVVALGENLDSDSPGVVSIPYATSSSKGLIEIGAGLTVTNGLVDIDESSFADATDSSKGYVQIGTNIDVTAGVISIPDASTSSKGVAQPGVGLGLNSGALEIFNATEVDKGIIQPGAGFIVNAGILDFVIGDATVLLKGLVQIGDNIDVASGVISIADASGASTKGLVKSADTANISITAGDIDVGANIPKLDEANTYTKAQVSEKFISSFASPYTPDFSKSNVIELTMTGNITNINTPINAVPGGVYTVIFKQDAVGGRMFLGFSNVFKINSFPTQPAQPNGIYVYTFICLNSTTFYVMWTVGF